MLTILVVALSVLIAAYIAVKLIQLQPQKFFLVVVGFIVGALIGALLSVPLTQLIEPYRTVLPVTVTALSSLTFIFVFYSQSAKFSLPSFGSKSTASKGKGGDNIGSRTQILVDTSAIIDGRIADIAGAGFVPGKLLVPRFVLAELQNIADSEDPMRRGRGRRGLEMLNVIRQNPAVELDIIEENPADIKEVDHKLVRLARDYKTDILTTDYNLNRVATIEQVRVLNINELANAIRAVVLPGEPMQVKVVQAGKEKGQGVGYLEDGTMIVVENGDKLLGQTVDAEVTRIFQTVAGKMIFAAPVGSIRRSSNKPNHARKPSPHRRNQPKSLNK